MFTETPCGYTLKQIVEFQALSAHWARVAINTNWKGKHNDNV